MGDYKVNPEQCELVCLKISISKRWKFISSVLLRAAALSLPSASSPGIGNIFRPTTTRTQKRVATKYDYIISVNAFIKCSFAFHAHLALKSKFHSGLSFGLMHTIALPRANICISGRAMLKMHLLMAFDLANKFVRWMRFNTRFNKIRKTYFRWHSLLFRCYLRAQIVWLKPVHNIYRIA